MKPPSAQGARQANSRGLPRLGSFWCTFVVRCDLGLYEPSPGQLRERVGRAVPPHAGTARDGRRARAVCHRAVHTLPGKPRCASRHRQPFLIIIAHQWRKRRRRTPRAKNHSRCFAKDRTPALAQMRNDRRACLRRATACDASFSSLTYRSSRARASTALMAKAGLCMQLFLGRKGHPRPCGRAVICGVYAECGKALVNARAFG